MLTTNAIPLTSKPRDATSVATNIRICPFVKSRSAPSLSPWHKQERQSKVRKDNHKTRMSLVYIAGRAWNMPRLDLN